MKIPLILALALVFCGNVLAQETIPAGTILPIALNASLNTGRIKAGQSVKATVMQDVPAGTLRIPARSKVFGSIVETSSEKQNGNAKLVLRFNTVEIGKSKIPITTTLRAMASMMEVYQAQLPATGPDRGTGENVWTTTQVGGQVVYRGGGPVADGLRTVGEPAPNGVLARAITPLGSKCHADTSDNTEPQAFWVFSSDACGLYGMSGIALSHSGRTEPIGQIVLTSDHGEINLRSGSGLLLRVIPQLAR